MFERAAWRKAPLLGLLALLPVFCAEAAEALPRERATVSGADATALERFGQYGDNYAIYNTMRNNGWGQHDESAIRAHYSFKFTFCGPQFNRSSLAQDKRGREPRESKFCPRGDKASLMEFFAAYTGEFDFYAGTRESGPVINRLSNPGLYARIPLRLYLPLSPESDDHVQLGIEHRSDGQVTEVNDSRGAERAQAAYQARDRHYFDTISRGADYLSLGARLFDVFGVEQLELHGKLRLYLSQDAAVTWGPLANTGRKFSDYDRLQLMAAFHPSGWGRWELEWRLGDRGLATDSFTFGWQAESESFPLYVRLHRGPMNTLSNYTQRQDSIGVGLRFAKF